MHSTACRIALPSLGLESCDVGKTPCRLILRLAEGESATALTCGGFDVPLIRFPFLRAHRWQPEPLQGGIVTRNAHLGLRTQAGNQKGHDRCPGILTRRLRILGGDYAHLVGDGSAPTIPIRSRVRHAGTEPSPNCAVTLSAASHSNPVSRRRGS